MIVYVRAAVHLVFVIVTLVFGTWALSGAVIKALRAIETELGGPAPLFAALYFAAAAALLAGRQGKTKSHFEKYAAFYAMAYAAVLGATESPTSGFVGIVSFLLFYKGVTPFIDNFGTRLRLEPVVPVAARDGTRQLVLIEGNIGAGKSALSSALEEHLGQRIRVEHETLPEHLHQAFVEDPCKYAYVLQMVMADRRKRDYERWQTDEAACRTFVDRSILGDMAFAVADYVLGRIDADQFETYLASMGGSPVCAVESRRAANVVLAYIHTPVAVCAERIAQRGNVNCHTELDYLHMVSVAHLLCLLTVMRDSHEQVVLVDGARAWPANCKEAIKFVKKLGKTMGELQPSVPAYKNGNKAPVLSLGAEAGKRFIDLADKFTHGKGFPRSHLARDGGGDDDVAYEVSEERWFAYLRKEFQKAGAADATPEKLRPQCTVAQRREKSE